MVNKLRDSTTNPWIDNEHIISGDDILDGIGAGLGAMDIFVVLFSHEALHSAWVDLEIKHAFIQELTGHKASLMIFIIDDTRVEELPWFVQHRNIRVVSNDPFGASAIVADIMKVIERRTANTVEVRSSRQASYNAIIEPLIRGIDAGDWHKAEAAALKVLEQTDRFGHNELFNLLLEYQDIPHTETLFWGAMQTAEVCVQLAPWLITHEALARLAAHRDFSPRATAASMCMDLANIAPERVPIDILVKLATPNEDWYVDAPATAALKTMARTQRPILRVFYQRLRSPDPYLRQHAARALAEIATEDPDILAKHELSAAVQYLQTLGDSEAASSIANALSHVPNEPSSAYKYGL